MRKEDRIKWTDELISECIDKEGSLSVNAPNALMATVLILAYLREQEVLRG